MMPQTLVPYSAEVQVIGGVSYDDFLSLARDNSEKLKLAYRGVAWHADFDNIFVPDVPYVNERNFAKTLDVLVEKIPNPHLLCSTIIALESFNELYGAGRISWNFRRIMRFVAQIPDYNAIPVMMELADLIIKSKKMPDKQKEEFFRKMDDVGGDFYSKGFTGGLPVEYVQQKMHPLRTMIFPCLVLEDF